MKGTTGTQKEGQNNNKSADQITLLQVLQLRERHRLRAPLPHRPHLQSPRGRLHQAGQGRPCSQEELR